MQRDSAARPDRSGVKLQAASYKQQVACDNMSHRQLVKIIYGEIMILFLGIHAEFMSMH